MCEETHYRLCNVVRSYSYWWVNNLFLSLQILWLIRFSYRFQQFNFAISTTRLFGIFELCKVFLIFVLMIHSSRPLLKNVLTIDGETGHLDDR